MPTNNFRGDAQEIAQVETYQVGGTVGAGTVRITINLKYVEYEITGAEADADEVAANFLVLLVASTIKEFTEVAWSIDDAALDTIIGTAAEAGVPFVTSVSDTGTITFTKSSVTSSSGSRHWDDPTNWSLNAVPVDGDDVVIQNNATNILYGIDQTGIQLASLTIDASYTGSIGLPQKNADYYEYRTTYLTIESPIVKIGEGLGVGSGRIKLNLQSGAVVGASTVTIEKAGPPTDGNDLPSIIIKGTHASNTLTVRQGTFGSAIFAGETSVWSAVTVGYENTPGTDANLFFDTGVTLTTITMGGGVVTASSNVTTLVNNGGTFVLLGSGTLGTATIDVQGTVNYQSTGTITAMTLRDRSILDFRQNPKARTMTNCTMFATTEIHDPNKTVTRTNPIQLSGCGYDDVTLNLGNNVLVP